MMALISNSRRLIYFVQISDFFVVVVVVVERNKQWGLGRWLNRQFPHPSLIHLSSTDISSSVKYRSHKIICYKLVLVVSDAGSTLSVCFPTAVQLCCIHAVPRMI